MKTSQKETGDHLAQDSYAAGPLEMVLEAESVHLEQTKANAQSETVQNDVDLRIADLDSAKRAVRHQRS